MVGCCFLSVVPPPLCCPPPVSLSAPSSPKTCQQSPGCSAQFSCQMALSGTTGDRMKACPQRQYSWLQNCRQPTCARWQLPRRNDLRRRSSLLTSATRKVQRARRLSSCRSSCNSSWWGRKMALELQSMRLGRRDAHAYAILIRVASAYNARPRMQRGCNTLAPPPRPSIPPSPHCVSAAAFAPHLIPWVDLRHCKQ
jgi:hypothetical protein